MQPSTPDTPHVTNRLEQIYTLTDLLQTMLDPKRAMDGILLMIRQVVEHESGVLFLVDKDTRHLNKVSVYGEFVDMISSVPFTSGHGLSSWVAKEQRPVFLPAIQRRHEYGSDIRSFMSVPLTQKERVLGVMNFGHSIPGAFTKDDLEILLNVTEPLAPLITALLDTVKYDGAGISGQEPAATIEAECLKAVQQTVVSLNHEINNPLSSLLLNTELTLRSLDDSEEELKQRLTAVQQEAERIARFVQSLGRIQTVVTKDYIPGLVQMLDVPRSIGEE